MRALPGAGAGAVGKSPRIQELYEKPGFTENNLWTSLFQVMQLWKRNLPPRRLRRQVIGHKQHLGARVICHEVFFLCPARLSTGIRSQETTATPPWFEPCIIQARFSPRASAQPGPLPSFTTCLFSFRCSVPSIGTSYGIIQYYDFPIPAVKFCLTLPSTLPFKEVIRCVLS